jgi:hypothetical protein
LNFEIGSGLTSDKILITGLLSASGPVTLNITALTGAGVGKYTLLTFGSFSGLNNFTVTQNGGAFSYSLSNDSSNEYLTVSLAQSSGTVYWKGNLSGTWNTISGSSTNWYSDIGGTTNTALPGSSADVKFATTNATVANLTTTLGQNFSINSLEILGTAPTSTNSVTIAGDLRSLLEWAVSP